MSEPILADLERDEAYRATPYKDSRALWTFAIGRNLETNPLTGAEWKQLLDASQISVSISKAGADALLASGVQAVRLWCARTFRWWPDLDTVRQDVIAEMVFNLGSVRFMGFHDFLAAVSRGDWVKAEAEMWDSIWSGQVDDGPGKRFGRVDRLAAMMRTGVRP
jgi:GH24 family phage-related lysozyme (muramidase)